MDDATQGIPPSPSTRPLLVSYDISDDKRRNRLHRLLSAYGEPMHESVFLCWLNPQQQQRLQIELDHFSAKEHPGEERIACIEARPTGPLANANGQTTEDWIIS
ncbi:MAG: CRISPR-associated endonuclease Cas2 [Sterolibacterium sp.]|jgi:CRISPR-associated endonuclease Cas2|nr:CRISPR-associated endonuclease Cas2 [Sterolibacterium sp.]MBP9799423.1 CRISPR-associated endonuclease Cas2 [Sterolibacterium sp.]